MGRKKIKVIEKTRRSNGAGSIYQQKMDCGQVKFG